MELDIEAGERVYIEDGRIGGEQFSAVSAIPPLPGIIADPVLY
jgi:hypothetical protein